MNRRDLFRATLSLSALTVFRSQSLALSLAPATQRASRFQIGACDWSIGPAGDINTFAVAKQIGLDGVQISLNTMADQEHLRRPETRRQFADAAQKAGVQIGGLAIGLLNEVPYKLESKTDAWVQDSVDVAKDLGVENILLAFFAKNDLRNDKKGQQAVIDKLKAVAPKAEKAGITLGIESWLSAPEHMAIIDAVGSPAVKVYYDVCNSTVMGYDIFKEMRDLGKNQICEIHIKENGSLIGKGQVDLAKVRQTIDNIGYRGWLVIEGAVPSGKPMLESYIENNKTVRNVFG